MTIWLLMCFFSLENVIKRMTRVSFQQFIHSLVDILSGHEERRK
jgi:hypothetical protein